MEKKLKISRETRAQAEMNVISQLFSSNIAQKSNFVAKFYSLTFFDQNLDKKHF